MTALASLPALPSPGFARKTGKAATQAPTKPALVAVDVRKLPEGTPRPDLFMLMGQSNMKGLGNRPEEPTTDPRIVMMHLKVDQKTSTLQGGGR